MKEIEIIEKMIRKKPKRKDDLIVKNVFFEKGKGKFSNQHWAYDVGYCFRDALDIQYQEKQKTVEKTLPDGKIVKEKTTYMSWTQGAIISFKQGDLLINREKSQAVQVQYAVPMGWDVDKDSMYLGAVMYKIFEIKDGSFFEKQTNLCTQIDFLSLLVGEDKDVKIGY